MNQSRLYIYDTGTQSAAINMKIDFELLQELNAGSRPILHLYRWNPRAVSFGYFIKPESVLRLDALKMHNIDIAQRPTGGGVVFHLWDLAFSFLLPSSHPAFSSQTIENYRFVNESVLEVVKSFFHLDESIGMLPISNSISAPDERSFCMARPTIYDVMIKGKKVAGAAERKRKNGYLHQGTISLMVPDEELLKETLLSSELLFPMMHYSFAPLPLETSAIELERVKTEIEKRLADNLSAKL